MLVCSVSSSNSESSKFCLAVIGICLRQNSFISISITNIKRYIIPTFIISDNPLRFFGISSQQHKSGLRLTTWVDISVIEWKLWYIYRRIVLYHIHQVIQNIMKRSVEFCPIFERENLWSAKPNDVLIHTSTSSTSFDCWFLMDI